jgi:hypothetical protein
MPATTNRVVESSVVDFTNSSNAKWRDLGKATVLSIKSARVWMHYEVCPQAGEYANKIITLRIRMPGTIDTRCELITGKSKTNFAKAVEVKVKKIEKKNKAIEALDIKDVNPGDIVSVKNKLKGTSYDFKVYEIDYNQCRLKGWATTFSQWDVGSKMGWVSFNHDSVEITMKTRKAFKVEGDPLYERHKEKSGRVGEKRAATRQRRATLRSIYGF